MTMAATSTTTVTTTAKGRAPRCSALERVGRSVACARALPAGGDLVRVRLEHADSGDACEVEVPAQATMLQVKEAALPALGGGP